MLKDVDIHSVTGIFKSFLRELPEILFTDILYRRFIETFNKFSSINENELNSELQKIFADVPPQNKNTIYFILDHLLKWVWLTHFPPFIFSCDSLSSCESFLKFIHFHQFVFLFLLLHRVHEQENENKMSLHNLAMVFGPTLLRPAFNSTKQKDLLETSTVDVMAQAGILYCFLQARKNWNCTELN